MLHLAKHFFHLFCFGILAGLILSLLLFWRGSEDKPIQNEWCAQVLTEEICLKHIRH